jgi:hypothetical protein
MNLFNKICDTVCCASHKIYKRMFIKKISLTALIKWQFIKILYTDTCVQTHTHTHTHTFSFCPSVFSKISFALILIVHLHYKEINYLSATFNQYQT